MRVICDGIDAGDIGRQPKLFRQLFDGNERILVENRPGLGRDGHKHGIGNGVDVFQIVERDNVRVVFLEMVPDVDVDRYQVLGARSESQHDKQREKNGQPPTTHDEVDAALQIHLIRPSGERTSGDRTENRMLFCLQYFSPRLGRLSLFGPFALS